MTPRLPQISAMRPVSAASRASFSGPCTTWHSMAWHATAHSTPLHTAVWRRQAAAAENATLVLNQLQIQRVATVAVHGSPHNLCVCAVEGTGTQGPVPGQLSTANSMQCTTTSSPFVSCSPGPCYCAGSGPCPAALRALQAPPPAGASPTPASISTHGIMLGAAWAPSWTPLVHACQHSIGLQCAVPDLIGLASMPLTGQHSMHGPLGCPAGCQ